MKLRNILAFAAVAAMLVFTSCKKKTDTPDHLKVIPTNSAVVLSIEAEQLVDKGGLNKYKEFNIYKFLSKELAESEPEASKMMEEFLKNTRTTGLNLDQIFMYVRELKGEYSSSVAVFTFGVDNSTKFGNWLTTFVEKVKKDDEYKLEDKGEYKMFRIDYSTLFVWNSKVAIMIPASSYMLEEEGDLGEWLKIDETNSIATNADFMTSRKKHNDVTAWLPFERLMSLLDAEEQLMYNPILAKVDMKDASFELSLNFTDEKAAMTYSVWPESVMEKCLKEFPVIKTNFEESLYTYFPDTTYLAVKMAINPTEYYRLLVDNMRVAVDSLEAKYKGEEESEDYYYYGGYEYYEYKKILEAIDNPKVDSIAKLFKGDFIGTIFGFEKGLIPMPNFAVATTLNGEQAFNDLLALLPKEIIYTKEGSYYVISTTTEDSPVNIALYFGLKGDVLYLTNKKDAITNFYAQGYKKNLTSAAISGDIKSCPIYWHVNTNIEEYPGIITMSLRGYMGEEGYGILSGILKTYQAFDMKYDGKNMFEISIKQTSKKENTFKTIVNNIDKAVKNYLR